MMVAPGFDSTPTREGVDTMPALADLTASFIDEVAGEPCDVIGQSFGGFLSVWFAVRHADKIGFLVPQCPSGFRPKDKPPKPKVVVPEGTRSGDQHRLPQSHQLQPQGISANRNIQCSD